MDISAHLVKRQVVLERRVDPFIPQITADKKRLTQILYNLIGNALKFTHKGSVTVEVKFDPLLQQVLLPLCLAVLYFMQILLVTLAC